jgi:pantoate--beta-alanine ligase
LTTRIVDSAAEWKSIRKSPELINKKIGFVPTMGALHKGHASLIERSVAENDFTVVSVFVNPTQFDNPNDLQKYPRTFEKDIDLSKKLNVDFIFYPWYNDLYPDNYSYKVIENEFGKTLCGAHRPGHFDGVLTIVMKLLNIISPTRAYFGKKDYQQYKLIDKMCKAFFMDVEIIPCKTVRDDDGLALSSRNILLSNEERIVAQKFPQLLKSGKKTDEIRRELEKLGFKVDYIEEIDNRRFGAVHLGKVRLIDNVEI